MQFFHHPGDDTLTIKNSVTWEFCFEDKENLTSWLIHLIQHAADHRRWKQAATEKMEVLEPKHVAREATLRKPYKRTRSKLVLLYNDHGN